MSEKEHQISLEEIDIYDKNLTDLQLKIDVVMFDLRREAQRAFELKCLRMYDHVLDTCVFVGDLELKTRQMLGQYKEALKDRNVAVAKYNEQQNRKKKRGRSQVQKSS